MSSRKPLARDTVLVCAPELDLRVDACGELTIRREQGELLAGAHALRVLAAFDRPRPLAEVVDELAAALPGLSAFMALTSTIHQLHDAGVLIPPGRLPAFGEGPSFSRPAVHVSMLGDVARTRAFIEAIEATVTPDDVVVDIGTGTGILALAAARAGARHVYAIEASVMAESARAVVEHNGFADRVTVLQGWSSKLSLPERANVLVTETIGNDPFEENILSIVADAKRRLLTPSARVIPCELELVAVPCRLHPELRRSLRFTPEHVASFDSLYGFRLSPLLERGARGSVPFTPWGHQHSQLEPIGPVAQLLDVDLQRSDTPLDLDGEAALLVDRDAELDAVVLGFRAKLSPGVDLHSVPGQVPATHSWSFRGRALLRPMPLRAGERVQVRYGFHGGKAKLRLLLE